MTETETRTTEQTFAEIQVEENPEVNLSLGKRIRSVRESLGFTQADICDDIYLSQGYYSQVENDDVQEVGFTTAIEIARGLGLGISFFEGKKDEKVFLRPQARNLQVISSSLKDEQQAAIRSAVNAVLPSSDCPELEYINYNHKAKGLKIIIERARISKGWQQWRAASETSLSQGYFSQLENGEVLSPSIATLRRISKGMNIDFHYLLGLKTVAVPEEIKRFDRFLRDSNLPEKEKARTLNTLTDFVQLVINTPPENLIKFGKILSS